MPEAADTCDCGAVGGGDVGFLTQDTSSRREVTRRVGGSIRLEEDAPGTIGTEKVGSISGTKGIGPRTTRVRRCTERQSRRSGGAAEGVGRVGVTVRLTNRSDRQSA